MQRHVRTGPLVSLGFGLSLLLAATAVAQDPRQELCETLFMLADEGVSVPCRADDGCPGAIGCVRGELECRSCGGHGFCQLGECLCFEGWRGDDCSTPAVFRPPLID
ncbi:MAG: hypothetical protein ACREQ9_10920 [Candidatus Binatia bacterium]